MNLRIRASQLSRRGPASGRWLALLLVSVLVAACASERGLQTGSSIAEAVQEAVRPVTEPNEFAVPPRPVPSPIVPANLVQERFDIDVMNAEASDFFTSLVEGTDLNLVVHPEVTGQISLTLKQVTLRDVLEMVRDRRRYNA